MLGKISIAKNLRVVEPLSLASMKQRYTYFHRDSVCLMVIAPSSENFMSIDGYIKDGGPEAV